MSPRRGLALAAVAALPLSALATLTSPAVGSEDSMPDPVASSFQRMATYPVFENVPDGVDPLDPTVAEISSVSRDGNTVAYTDALGGRIGFLDITDPASPEGIGSHDVSGSEKGGQPTSVSITDSSDGEVALVVVDDSTYPGLEDTEWEDEDPAPGEREGRVDIVKLEGEHDEVASIDLGGQPDSIAISPDGNYAAIAMENQRNEAVTPEGGEEGDLPQAPAGFVQVIDLSDPDPTTWEAEPIELPAEALEGMDTPEDAEPEYVDINEQNKLALTLQENNGVVVIDLPTGEIDSAFSAGNAQVDGIDIEDDGLFDATGSIDAPREPDAVQWVGPNLLATANEGDWKGGTRGWSVFDATTGEVKWDAGNTFEQIATRHGLHNNDRAGKKGAEPEGLAFDEIGGVPYAFVGSERSNFVAVYDMSDPVKPVFRQALATTNGPEGLLPIPERDLLVVSSEEDDSEANVRATVGIFQLGEGANQFPSIISEDDQGGTPIGWGALGALSQDPASADHLWTASDAAYATGRIYHLNVAQSPARIESVLEVTNGDGSKAKVDIEGISARKDGGFWIASEGAAGPKNKVHRLNDDGEIVRTISLPKEVRDGLGKQGLEGISATGSGAAERVYVTLQREVEGEKFVRIGRLNPREDQWTWFGYRLESTDVEGDWIGLSEIMVVDANTLAVIERDKLNGPRAALKAIYTVDVPAGHSDKVRMLTKRKAHDVLPDLRAQNGWTQEKLEGLGVTKNGRVFVVTDNDGLEDATGETQLLELGMLRQVFQGSFAVKGTTTLKVAKRKVVANRPLRVTVTVKPTAKATGRVQILDRGKVVRNVKLVKGRAVVTLRLKKGPHMLRAKHLGSVDVLASTSKMVKVQATKPPKKKGPKTPKKKRR